MLIFIISTLWMVVGLSLPQAPNAYPAFRTGNLLSAAGGGKVHYRATTRVAAKQRARHGRTIVLVSLRILRCMGWKLQDCNLPRPSDDATASLQCGDEW
jgi:hypothetical protein